MIKFLKNMIIFISLVIGFSSISFPTLTYATPVDDFCNSVGNPADSPACKKGTDVPTFIKDLINTLLWILGVVSVIVIIIAGITYTTSHGDQNLVTKAKNTLMYAIVGLVVAVMAYAIVNWVLATMGI